MRLVTWNLNSIRQRLPRLLAMLERHAPDVVCLQETKVEDDVFPTMDLQAAGYEAAILGQRAYNGVAILARAGLGDVRTGFDGDPIPEQSRVVSATVDGTPRRLCLRRERQGRGRPRLRDEARVARCAPRMDRRDPGPHRAADRRR